MSHALPKQQCPVCDHKIDRVSGVSGKGKVDDDVQPNPGDITMCVYCRSFLIFTAELGHREATDEEIAELPHDQRMLLSKARRLAKEVFGGQPRKV